MCTPAIAVLALSTQLAIAVPVYCVVLTLRGMSDPVYTAFVQERVPEGIGPTPQFGDTPPFWRMPLSDNRPENTP